MISRKNNINCHLAKIRGFSLFEFAIVALIFAVLVAVLLNRMTFYQDEAERVKVEQVVGILRVALQIKVGDARVQNSQAAVDALLDQNPMDWLKTKPPNYLGEYYEPKLETLYKGNWFFERRSKTLVYLLNKRKTFDDDPVNLLKFKVKFPRLPSNPAKLSGPSPMIRGVVLDQVFDHDSRD